MGYGMEREGEKWKEGLDYGVITRVMNTIFRFELSKEQLIEFTRVAISKCNANENMLNRYTF